MRYVILRDDDTNALTPVDCLERLYRPFLNRNLAVNLAVIPEVATDTTMPTGELEGFLFTRNGSRSRTLPIAGNEELVGYLHQNRGYHVVQHGLHHEYFEFNEMSGLEAAERMDRGARLLQDAGWSQPDTFVAPYDKLSRESLREAARRFRVISGGWYERGRVPRGWWPNYAIKKIRHSPHWRIGGTALLSHPGCLLSRHRDYDSMVERVMQTVVGQRLTVLVTHWWEYFPNGQPDEPFIRHLHRTAECLSEREDIKVVSFSAVADGSVPLE